ncbi:hypothetical protein BHM03_00035068 [Ensete ventricosum]|nr:hypothetical protein BHM03_00035068 [Ensete ventricosum]
MACFHLCKNRGGYYLTAQVGFRVNGAPSNNKGWKSRYLFVSGMVWGFMLDWSAHSIGNAPHQMDLGELRGIPKVFGDKAPSTHATAPAREVGASPARETPKASSKRSIDASTEQVDDPAWRPKKMKVLMRRHKSRHDEGETRSCSKGKEPATPSEELETPAESDEEGASPVHHRPRSMNDLFKTKVHKDDAGYYTMHMSDLASEKELIEVQSNLAEIQRLLKEARVRARKMDDELLQSVKALESTRVELPKQVVDRYKESVGFKEGLKRMGRVTYEYEYRVTLTRFRALHPDSEVEEDPFTIHPEDALVPMKRQQAFDDSDPSES